MKADLPEAAVRLMACLPVHTIERREPPKESRQLAHYYATKEKRKVTGRGRGGLNKRPFLIEGRRYDGIHHAARALHRSPHTIRAWLASGRARYL